MVEEQLYTDLEALVLKYLIGEQVQFEFKTSLAGGFSEWQGVEFIIPDGMLAWKIIGEYYYKVKNGSDIIRKEILSGKGLALINLYSDDLLNRLDETMRLALEGREILR